MAAERDEQMWDLAYELAKSGDYPNSQYIEIDLRSLGFRDVDQIALNRAARKRITELCLEARKKKSDA